MNMQTTVMAIPHLSAAREASPVGRLVLAVAFASASLLIAASARFGEARPTWAATEASSTGVVEGRPPPDVDVRPDGSIVVTGVFRDTVDFDPGAGEDVRTAVGGFDVFVTRYAPDGSYVETRTIGGRDDDDPMIAASLAP